jgi:hypothetical protein
MANELTLPSLARRAYELGRLRWALRFALPVLAAMGAALACGRPAGICYALAAALLPLAVGLPFAGGSAGRAVPSGLMAGGLAMVTPLLVGTLGHLCGSDLCMTLCLPACFIGGAMAGALVAWRSPRGHELSFLLPAFLVAGLMGALGCTLSGAAGVLGMLAGGALAGAPVLLAARR